MTTVPESALNGPTNVAKEEGWRWVILLKSVKGSAVTMAAPRDTPTVDPPSAPSS